VHIDGPIIAFYIISIVILACAIMLLNFRKVVYMALAIGGVFIGCAAIYILLGAEFVGIAQVLIYAGAITILILFAIMLTNHQGEEAAMPWNLRKVATGVGCVLLAAVLLLTIRSQRWPQTSMDVHLNNGLSNPVAIGVAMFTNYLIPFELISLLLIVGLVGAVILAGQRKEEEPDGDWKS